MLLSCDRNPATQTMCCYTTRVLLRVVSLVVLATLTGCGWSDRDWFYDEPYYNDDRGAQRQGYPCRDRYGNRVPCRNPSSGYGYGRDRYNRDGYETRTEWCRDDYGRVRPCASRRPRVCRNSYGDPIACLRGRVSDSGVMGVDPAERPPLGASRSSGYRSDRFDNGFDEPDFDRIDRGNRGGERDRGDYTPGGAPDEYFPESRRGDTGGRGYGAPAGPNQGYRLGPGDVIKATVFGQEEFTTEAYISERGEITMPLVGVVRIGGYSPHEAERLIARRLVEGGYLVNPQVNVTVLEFRSQQISVLGQVNVPGRYKIESHTTVLDAIAQAEGIKEDGADYAVIVRHDNGRTRRLQVDLLRAVRDVSGRPILSLQNGDTIYVPKAAIFYIYGQVNEPNSYKLKPGTTVLQALSIGGGLTELASEDKIKIRRRSGDGRLYTIRPQLDSLVRPNDVIFVDEGLF